MINERINIYENVEALCEGFTSFLQEELEKKEKVNLSLSGGTTPKALFEYWSNRRGSSIDWNRIVFFWGDERCVPPNDPMSNYGVAKDLLFQKIETIDENKIHRIHGENEAGDEAKWYIAVMNEFLPKKNNLPSFDIMMLGLGDDGHTVSIFPDQINLWDSKDNCVVAKHPESGMPRVSLSGGIVNNSQNVAFLVTGKNKAEKVKQIIEERKKYFDTYPAAKVSPTDGDLIWFLDKEAASLL